MPDNATLERARRWLDGRRPVAAIVLGSGLGAFAGRLTDPVRLAYDQLPGFPPPGVAGHAGELIAGELGRQPVLCQSGRVHGYEGHAPDTIARPVRLFSALGIGTLLLTNAAGGIRRTLRPGGLMLVADQVNLTFRNPLHGTQRPGEPRFPDMSAPFDPGLRTAAHAVARREGIALADGVYAGVTGPSYETAAEIRMLERLGADAVGMSTVLEVVAARARGMRCLAVSTITNHATGIGRTPLTHDEVMAAAAQAGDSLGRLLTGVIAEG